MAWLEVVANMITLAVFCAWAVTVGATKLRLTALFPNPDSHPSSGRGGTLETVMFTFTGEHRVLKDPMLTRLVLTSRVLFGAAAAVLVACLLVASLAG